jgi:hypothetical protein
VGLIDCAETRESMRILPAVFAMQVLDSSIFPVRSCVCCVVPRRTQGDCCWGALSLELSARWVGTTAAQAFGGKDDGLRRDTSMRQPSPSPAPSHSVFVTSRCPATSTVLKKRERRKNEHRAKTVFYAHVSLTWRTHRQMNVCYSSPLLGAKRSKKTSPRPNCIMIENLGPTIT